MKSTFPLRSKPFEERIREIAEIIVDVAKDKIAFVILFGSFARGTWVRDRYSEGRVIYEYVSDYDFLVVTKTNGTQVIEDKIEREISKRGLERRVPFDIKHSASFVVEPLEHVNAKLKEGHYFFSDIKKEGILLYDSGEFKLAEAKVLSKKEIKKIAQEDYEHWFEKGEDFLLTFKTLFDSKKFNSAAFQLHQATESLYNCTLLTLTGYKPKTHDLLDLNRSCAAHSKDFLTIFPLNKMKKTKPTNRNLSKIQIEKLYHSNKNEDAFKLLKHAYIEARYNKNFKIRKEQLEYLVERVERLKAVVVKVCKGKI